MKKYIFSILAVGIASFALCSCGKAQQSIKGKDVDVTLSAEGMKLTFPMHFDDETMIVDAPPVLGASADDKMKLNYTYSKKTGDKAEIKLSPSDEKDKYILVEAEYITPTEGNLKIKEIKDGDQDTSSDLAKANQASISFTIK